MSFFSAIGDAFNFVISKPLGYVLYWCYFITRNYGLSILLFTVITRLLLFPLAIKQQKSTAEMVRMQPKLQQLQKKYAKDKQKLQQEQMKLYQEEGYSPLGGCLPMLIQLPIIWGLFNVIYRPYTYILNMSSSQIKGVANALGDNLLKAIKGEAGAPTTIANVLSNSRGETYIAHALSLNPELATQVLPKGVLNINFNLFGLDLTQNPTFSLSWYVLIPILCYVTSLFSTWLAMKMNQNPGTGATPGAAGMNKSMMLIMPLVSAFFSLQVPSGVGFYWICTNLFMVAQVLLLNKFYNTKVLAAKAEERAQIRRGVRDTADSVEEETEAVEAGGSEQKKSAQTIGQQRTNIKNKSHKKTKKQLMEENRRRLSAAREKENKD